MTKVAKWFLVVLLCGLVLACAAPARKRSLEEGALPDAGGQAGGSGMAGAAGEPMREQDAGGSSVVSDAGVMHELDAALSDATTPPPGACEVAFASESRCTISEDAAECPFEQMMLGGRVVTFQRPLGAAPSEGWPAVIMYQGSFVNPVDAWKADSSMAFGALNQAKLQAMLLDQGFVVIAPAQDGIAWATNFPNYDGSSDATFIPLLIENIKAGVFGAVDAARLFATGISSGGYMTSRMAVSYAGTFRALAINAGSYATCSGGACAVPDPLPADHPPTLFLHGERDVTVPIATAEAYKAQLDAQGLEAEMTSDPNVIHAWLKVAPQQITCWFLTH